MKALLVESNVEIAEALTSGLLNRGVSVETAADTHDALIRATLVDFDVIVIDDDLRGSSVEAFVRALASRGCTSRLLLLTSVVQRVDPISAVLSVDDRLAKPYTFAELLRRIRQLASTPSPDSVPLVRGELNLDRSRRVVTRAGRFIPLSPIEFALLDLLMSTSGRVVSNDELLAHAWSNREEPAPAVLKVAISRLRAKLGPPPVIHTVAGRGYRA